MSGSLKRDENSVPVAGGVSSTDANAVLPMTIDSVTGRLKTDASGGATGTVTSVSVVSANGFAGSVATATTTPAITISTTITGIIKGDGTAISAASAATDYAAVAFKTIAVSGQSDIVADSPVDTLTLVGSGVTITTNATTDTITFTVSPSGLTVGTSTITSGTNTRVLYDNAGVLGEYSVSGSGNVAMTTSPAFTTPSLGAATAISINSLTITTSTGTLTITNLKTLSVSNTLTFTGTDGSSVAFGAGGTVLYTSSTIPLTIGTTTITSGTNTRILYNNSGVLGEYTLTGTGTVVAMQTAPTFATSITTPAVLATANDSGALGASGTAFSDLFLASGGVINWAAGDYTLVHSSGVLTANKDLRITSANVGTNADSVPTISSTSILTNKTLTSPTIQTTPVYAAGTNLVLTAPSSDDTATGEITNAFNSGYSSSAIGDLVYLDSSSNWQKADADASATTYSGLLGIALEVKASGNALKVLLRGFAYCSTAFPTFTVGVPVYMSATAGAITATAPSTTDSATRVIGYAVHADKIWFNPSNDYITHT